MRLRTISLALAAAAIMVLGLAGGALAFHDGGVASCNGCHTMHNSSGNAQMYTGKAQFDGVEFLLKGSDQSSACLSCHGSGSTRSGYHVFTTFASYPAAAPQQHTPGGDFTWLLVGTSTDPAVHSTKGHNIIAADFGLTADSRAAMGTSPGGSYPNSSFNCISCHDPHGRYRVDSTGAVILPQIGQTFAATSGSGSYGDVAAAGEAVGVYRILGGKGYLPVSVAAVNPALAFDANTDPPVAVAPSSYNVTIGDVTVAYGQGMSEWCANCHANIHNDTYPTILRHPAGDGAKLTTAVAANYNAYVKTGDLTGAGGAAAYWPLVPFEQGSTDKPTLLGYTTTPVGADTTKNVMCLSCHRAHASGFNAMLRWNNTLMVAGGAYVAPPGGFDNVQTPAAYYDKPVSDFAAEQRSLCNKCHVKD